MKIWVTSDHHFGHKPIIKIQQRPFKDVKEMNQFMAKRWNSVVAPDDLVYYLGDFALSNKATIGWILDSLNGRKILIKGNHDTQGLFFYLRFFEGVFDQAVYRNVLLSHEPQYDHTYRANFHGHIHTQKVELLFPHLENKFVNVCAENYDYYPLDFHKLISKI